MDQLNSLAEAAAAVKIDEPTTDWLEIMLQTTYSAGIIRASAGVAAAKAQLQVFEEYITAKTACQLLKAMHPDYQGAAALDLHKSTTIDRLLGTADIVIPGVLVSC